MAKKLFSYYPYEQSLRVKIISKQLSIALINKNTNKFFLKLQLFCHVSLKKFFKVLELDNSIKIKFFI